jgi:hypothetical protein
VVSSEGKVEFVTDNVGQFTRFSKDDVLGKSIYNFLHHGDHARFSSGLLPMAIGKLVTRQQVFCSSVWHGMCMDSIGEKSNITNGR